MMLRKLVLPVSLALFLALTGCGASSTPSGAGSTSTGGTAGPDSTSPRNSSDDSNGSSSSGKKIEVKLAHHFSQDSLYQRSFEKFAQVAMQEDPELDIKIFPNSQLGSEKDAIQQVKSGNLQMTVGDMATFSTYDSKLGVIGLPFMFATYDAFHKVLDGPVGTKLAQELLDKTGMHILTYMDGGLRNIYSTKPIKSMGDLKGLKIRVPEASLYVNTFKAMGANPVSVPAAQMYTSLQTGLVNAMEGTSETAYTFKIGEVAKYAYVTHHMISDADLIINDKFLQGLPKKAQEAIMDAAKQAQKYQRDSKQQEEDDYQKKLEQMGVTYMDADQAPLKKAVQSVYDDFSKATGGGDLITQIEQSK